MDEFRVCEGKVYVRDRNVFIECLVLVRSSFYVGLTGALAPLDFSSHGCLDFVDNCLLQRECWRLPVSEASVSRLVNVLVPIFVNLLLDLEFDTIVTRSNCGQVPLNLSDYATLA